MTCQRVDKQYLVQLPIDRHFKIFGYWPGIANVEHSSKMYYLSSLILCFPILLGALSVYLQAQCLNLIR